MGEEQKGIKLKQMILQTKDNCVECEYPVRCLANLEGHMVIAQSMVPCPRTEGHRPPRDTVSLRG